MDRLQLQRVEGSLDRARANLRRCAYDDPMHQHYLIQVNAFTETCERLKGADHG